MQQLATNDGNFLEYFWSHRKKSQAYQFALRCWIQENQRYGVTSSPGNWIKTNPPLKKSSHRYEFLIYLNLFPRNSQIFLS